MSSAPSAPVRFLRSIFFALILCAGIVPDARSTIIHVPGDAPTIQAGIDMASAGDTVEVACGTYEGGITLKDSIVLRSQTGLSDCVTIQVSGVPSGLLCQGLSSGVVIEGFRLDGMSNTSVGIRASQSSVTVRNCYVERFINDLASGGIKASNSTINLDNCVFARNVQGLKSVAGSGLSCFESTVAISNSVFEENRDEWQGGALGVQHSTVIITNCVFRRNRGESDYVSYVFGVSIWAISGILTIASSRFEENFCLSNGSSIYMNGGYLHVNDCNFEENIDLENVRRGGVHFDNGLIENSTFKKNQGGAIVVKGGSEVTIRDCLFDQNQSYLPGVDIEFQGQSCLIERCTVVRSIGWEAWGGGVSVFARSPVVLRQAIIAFGDEGRAVGCTGDGTVVMECCDIYGNEEGDWVGCVAGQENVNGNISADPLFCDLAGGDYTLHENSPCVPPQSGDCGQIGAFGVGCGSVHVEPSSWGSIKALYR